MTIHLKRAYEAPAESDGRRILVERLWPRGVSKETLRLDEWAKDVSPSPALRTWYGHDPAKWDEFQERYEAELDTNETAVAELIDAIGDGTVTFVFAAKDAERNSAVVLRRYLLARASLSA